MGKKYTSRLNEIGDTPEGQFMLGRLQGRQNRRARGEDTGGRIKKTTINANEYWRGTDFTAGENYEDYQSWTAPYDEYDSYGEWDSDAYRTKMEAMEQDNEYQCDLYRRVSNKLNKQNENMNRNTVRITESQLKQMITESVKRVINESIKAADPMNAVSREVAEKNGFTEEYSGIDGGFELWQGPLPEDMDDRKALLRRLGIKRFTSQNFMNNTCRITVDPSGKIAKATSTPSNAPQSRTLLRRVAQALESGIIDCDKAEKVLISKGFDAAKVKAWVSKFRTDEGTDEMSY